MARSRGSDHARGPAILDVRDMPPRLRHAKILRLFEALPPGAAFILVSDHDPKPLFYQFQTERPGSFGWRYLAEGPETWHAGGCGPEFARPPRIIVV